MNFAPARITNWLRIVCVLLVAGCVYAAIMQTNDVDATIWIVLYIAAAILGTLAAIGFVIRPVYLLIGVVSLGWSIWLATKVFGQQPLFDEEGREMFGLFILALWLGGVGLLATPRKAAS